MKLPALLVSDTHYVDETACEYRWGLWPFLRDTVKARKVRTITHLGDLVDRKDNHPASLVNRLTDEVKKTRDLTGVTQVFQRGNHDFLKDEEEFFRFLRHMDGVRYVTGPEEDPDVRGASVLYLPYAREPATAWKGYNDLSDYDYVFLHQTVMGARTSNGESMAGEGIPVELLRTARKIYSGDIHVPQVVRGAFGSVEYVGSPYHVHFGDDFTPRCVLLTAGGAEDILVPGMPRRVTVRASSILQLRSRLLEQGDQVKLRLELNPEERHEWSRLRREGTDWLRSRGVHVHGVELVKVGDNDRRTSNARAARISGASPEDALLRYVRDEGLGGDQYDVAMDLL